MIRCQNIKSDFIFINPPTKNIDEMNLSLDEFKSNLKNRPLIIGKYGKETEPKNRNGFSNPNSYESQTKYFIQRYATIGKRNLQVGSFGHLAITKKINHHSLRSVKIIFAYLWNC